MELLPSNAAHWHLVLNHLPVVGSMAAMLLLLWALFKNTDDLKRVALMSLVVVALASIPAFLTGEPAEDMLKGIQTSAKWMTKHEDIAVSALWVAIAAGAGALGSLVFFRKQRMIPRWLVGVLLVLNLAVCLLMLRTANYGGKIRHSEILAVPAAETER